MGIEAVEVVKCDTRQLAAQANGTSIPFVWGHTLLGSMAQENATGVFGWQELADIAKVIRFDAVGHGQSETSPNPADHTWERRADDIWTVAKSFTRGKRLVLGGASMGSATELLSIASHPEEPYGWGGEVREFLLGLEK